MNIKEMNHKDINPKKIQCSTCQYYIVFCINTYYGQDLGENFYCEDWKPNFGLYQEGYFDEP